MISRTYDVILTVNDVTSFEVNNVIIGNTTGTSGVIAAIDADNNYLKVKLSNTLTEFSSSEAVHSNVIVLTGTEAGQLDYGTIPFYSNTHSSNITTATATVSAITNNPIIAAKNAVQQYPLIRLVSIYYPGEWYPENENGNPSGKGAGRAWPTSVPIRIAQIVGDTAQDINYNTHFGSETYDPYPINIEDIDQAADGRINEVTMTLYNLGNIFSYLVESPYLMGNNISNSVVALVNNEYVHGIDPRTVDADPNDVGVEGDIAYDTLARARANALAYSSEVVNLYGDANSAFTYEQTVAVNGEWRSDVYDSRDLLGAVVNIKSTFANFLTFWPEYSLITSIDGTTVTVANHLPYRVGDSVVTAQGQSEVTIESIAEDGTLTLSGSLDVAASVDDPLYIVNPDADEDSYMEDVFKIDQLVTLSEDVASFALTSWLTYFKQTLPRRRYYKNTCSWVYKGPECQYPQDGASVIPGLAWDVASESLDENKANGYFTASNATTTDPLQDQCAKSFTACKLRNNSIHYGGFPGVGRRVPKL